MLKCSKCKATKDFAEFAKNKATRTGYSTWCKECRRAYESKETKAAWFQLNKDREQARVARWRVNNKARYSELQRVWRKTKFNYKTPENRAFRAEYRARIEQSTLRWVDADHKAKIKAIYQLAEQLSGPVKFEVDHIEPLKGEMSTGLHVWWNLQLLPRHLNRSARNKPKNITSPRVSDNFDQYLEELKIYAELYRKVEN